MSRRFALALLGVACAGAVSATGSRAVAAPDGGARVRTSTAAPALTAQELELARMLDVLTEMELLEKLEMLELLPALEEGDEE